MVYRHLPTLHFIHSDCYELFNLQQRQNTSQQTNTTSVMDSIAGGDDSLVNVYQTYFLHNNPKN